MKKTPVKVEYETTGKRPLEDAVVEPRKDWLEIYNEIQEYRKLNIADVDTMGCATLANDADDEKQFRYHILTSLQLSSQTKDPITAQAVRNLKANKLTPQSIVEMDPKFLDSLISKVGFHNRKTKYLQDTAQILIDEYNGDIPDSLSGLLALPGIGPKMAYLVLQEAWGVIDGIGVDTHVHRISNRLGWATGKTPEDTRKDLESWLPKEVWAPINVLLVGFGQTMCKPTNPNCAECPVRDKCPRIGTRKKLKK